MTTHRRLGVALFASALLTLGATTAAGARGESRPFAATLDGFANPMPTADPCILVNDEHGTGQSRHMGAITWASHETVNLRSNPNGADVHGQFVMTAANGDVITADYQTLAHLDFVTGEVTASGSWEITGGTGRFADASGNGVISAQGSLAPPFEVIGAMAGVIVY